MINKFTTTKIVLWKKAFKATSFDRNKTKVVPTRLRIKLCSYTTGQQSLMRFNDHLLRDKQTIKLSNFL